MACSGIYAIQRKDSDERYIGSAVNIAHRWRAHRSKLNRGVHYAVRLQNTWRKHGPDMFEFVLLEEVADKALLIEREQWWMDRGGLPAYNSRIRAESNLGYKHTDESRARMSAARMGNTHNLGHKHSDETRAKISAAHKALPPHSAESRAKMAVAWKSRPPRSAEHCAKLSVAGMGNTRSVGYKHSDETRARMSAGQKSRPPRSAETRARMSAAHKARWAKTREAA